MEERTQAKRTDVNAIPVDHNVRLLAIETAREHGIPFDERWYKIPLQTREVMIAARLGRAWMDTLSQEYISEAYK